MRSAALLYKTLVLNLESNIQGNNINCWILTDLIIVYGNLNN